MSTHPGKHVVIEFKCDGSVQVETHNFKGAGCEQASKFIEQALGKAFGNKRKAEYCAAPAAQTVRQ